MNIEKEIRERKNRWNALLSGAENAQNIITVNYIGDIVPKIYVTDGHYEQLSDWAVQKYFQLMDNMSWLQDDTIPFLDMLTGTEIFAEAFGCEVVYPQNNNPFALHKIESISKIAGLKTPNE